MRKLLIANRGEIAVRIARTAQAMGVATVAVYSDVDREAAHVEACDEAVALGGSAPGESYLRGQALVDAARRSGADAVHPGYGFLAENAAFARAVGDAGLTFVGPSPEAIAAMGDKLTAKARMREAGVPVLEAMDADDAAAIPPEAYPVLVKAASGGGGKGMRVVADPADLTEEVAACRRESAAAFGDDTVFVEPYLSRPRHVEVQILGDAHGRVVHLAERECSIQRRHQKVIEESPSPVVDEKLREQLGSAAVAAGEAIGYRGAGTVEFVLTERADGSAEFFFLEVNTRLQVEHPVTELAWSVGESGRPPARRAGTLAGPPEPLDLVRLQLLVADDQPLPFAQGDLRRVGHAIEARLYAEDPTADFLPAAGRLDVFEPAERAGVRWDVGFASGDEVSTFYDPLIAKVIAGAATRIEAAGRLARALEASRVHGPATNRDFLVACLRHDAFLAGDLHTGFIAQHLPAETRATTTDPELAEVHAGAAALADARARHRAQPVLSTLPPGWRNNRAMPQRATFAADQLELDVGYARHRDGCWHVTVARRDAGEADDAEPGRDPDAPRSRSWRVVGWPDERHDACLDAEIDGRRLRLRVTAIGTHRLVDSALGATRLIEVPRFAAAGAGDVTGGLTAPMPGTVTDVRVNAGDEVRAGQVLVVLEAMKMEHTITARHDATVQEVRTATGQTVAADEVLVVLQSADSDTERPEPASSR